MHLALVSAAASVLQSIPYEQQLEIRQQQVKELLDTVCSNYEFEGIKGSPIYEGYRNKDVNFPLVTNIKVVRWRLGCHRRGSFYDIVTVVTFSPRSSISSMLQKMLETTRIYFADARGWTFIKRCSMWGIFVIC